LVPEGTFVFVDTVEQVIDRESPLPYYHQLKQLLVADIAERGLKAGNRLPGDHELCAMYDVSRTVVRQALTELEYEGVIERFKGRGTYVAPPKTSEGLVQSLTGLFEDVRARGGNLRSELRRREIVPADDQVALALEIAVGDPVVEIERLRFVDGEPWTLNVTQLPASIGKPLLHEDLVETSLYELLEQKYGVRIVNGRRSVEAAVANKELASLLQIPASAAVLVLRGVSRGEGGVPVERFVAFHRGDRSRFEVDVERGQGGVHRPFLVRKET
jgi:GntR family transcriptional regulator